MFIKIYGDTLFLPFPVEGSEHTEPQYISIEMVTQSRSGGTVTLTILP